ncbi:hypothetical protein [Streptomyces bikiniensis]|uniref:hypothetical protein n=1 Tax=Streptomyces bikiniensis TaxID=1896 RepID=UPI00131A4F3C|nr:hypothetical protein [Streptomyces bikiniensis]
MSALFPEPTDPGRSGYLDAADRIKPGDTLLIRFPSEAACRSSAFKRAATRHGLSVAQAKEYVALARWFSPDMRPRIFSDVQISYTVLTEAARDYSSPIRLITSAGTSFAQWSMLRRVKDGSA